MDLETVGRDVELVELRALFDRGRAGTRALVLHGEAGIGKTTLWREGVTLARRCGHRVLVAAPSGAEAKLSFSVVRDLFDPVFDDVAEELPVPQRRALAAALLREDPVGRWPTPGAVASALLSALRALTRRSLVALAIDDVQWVDAASEAVVHFALRRLGEEPVAVLLARRMDASPESPTALDRSLPETRIARVELGPLSLGALHNILVARLGTSLSRGLLRRVHEASGGNPFFALEIARVLGPSASVTGFDPLPIGPNLHQLVTERLARFQSGTREALQIVAGLTRPTVAMVTAALGRDARRTLRPAIDAQVVEIQGEAVRFTHPLLASALEAELGDEARRALHRRLATITPDLEERARHLALASTGPDGRVAGVLETAGSEARARGAPSAAAELCEASARLTPEQLHESWTRRMLAAAQYHFDAGDAEHAEEMLHAVLGVVRQGPSWARALLWLQRVRRYGKAVDTDWAVEALAQAGTDAALRADIHYSMAMQGQDVDIRPAAAHARLAVRFAQEADDPFLVAAAKVSLLAAEFLLGHGVDRALADEASDLIDRIGPDPYRWAVAWQVGEVLMWADELDEARSKLQDARARAEERGDEGRIPYVLHLLALVEWRAGNWARAAELAAEGLEGARQAHQDFVGTTVLQHALALLDAHLGDVDLGRRRAEAGLAESRRGGLLFDEAALLGVLGFLALSVGNAHEAVRHLSEAARQAEALGFRDPGVLRSEPDLIQGLIELGRLDQAEALLEPFEASAHALDRPWPLATSARCRGMLQAARGDVEAALATLDRALREHARLGQPFELGRTLLALGRVQRRAKQRRPARESLERASAIFDRLGAALWSAKARDELARIGGRAPSGRDLTPTERQVAQLVAEGRSNPEVAAALFITVNTVEANLSRIYRKLQVRSRTELARKLLDAKG